MRGSRINPATVYEEDGETPMSIAAAAARASASMQGDAAGRELAKTRRSGSVYHARPSDITSPNWQGTGQPELDKQPRGSCCIQFLTFLSWLVFLITFPVSIFFCIKVIDQFERAVLFRMGRLQKGGEKKPGLIFILPCVDAYQRVDMRTMTFDVPPQEILTRDSVTVQVNAVVYYRIYDAVMSVINVADVMSSTNNLAQSMLRNILGTRDLIAILGDLDSISHAVQEQLDQATEPWGVTVERIDIKDVKLPVMLQRSMAAEAEATREARAKIIAAEGELQSSHLMRDAAQVINQTPSALQLRYLQTLRAISTDRKSTIIFPLPLDMATSLPIASSSGSQSQL